MRREMRRKDRAISEEEIKDILQKGEYGILSTIGRDCYPYGLPLNYIYREEENELMGVIYFHCAKEQGYKCENMIFCDKVSFTVVGETEVLPDKFSMKYESVIVFGKVKQVLEDKEEILREMIQKYSYMYKEEGEKYIKDAISKTGVYKIEIEHMSGKRRK